MNATWLPEYWPFLIAGCSAVGAIALFIERLFSIRKLALEVRELDDRKHKALVQPASAEEIAKYGRPKATWHSRIGSPWLSVVRNSLVVVGGSVVALAALQRAQAALVVAALLVWNAYETVRTVRSYRRYLAGGRQSAS